MYSLLKFFSLGKSEQGFNLCRRQNKPAWGLASHSHCCRIFFPMHISSNLQILVQVSPARMGKAALHIQTRRSWAGHWSLKAVCYSNSVIWWTSTSDLGCSRGWWANEWALHAVLSTCWILLETVLIVWLKTCILHGLAFFPVAQFQTWAQQEDQLG